MNRRSPWIVAATFALLALLLEAALVVYWNGFLQPRLQREAEQQAQVLAQAQADVLARALAADLAAAGGRIEAQFDALLLLREAAAGEAYFLAIALESDPEHGLQRSAGDWTATGFGAETELYHPDSGELLGLARVLVNDRPFRRFSADIRAQLMVQGGVVAGLLLLLGGLLATLLAKLEGQVAGRRRAEQALAEHEEKLRHLLDRLDNYVVYGRDAGGRLVSASDSVRRLFGFAPEEFVARSRDLLTAAEINRRSLAILAAQGGRTAVELEFELRDGDGQVHRIECNELPVFDRHGRLLGVDGIARDVTAQRRFEAELQRAKEHAESASRSKSQFLANMSHEIRTPMNAVLGLAGLLAKTALDRRQRDWLRQLETSARMLLGLIDDILDLSRIEAGKLTIQNAPFDLDTVLTDLTTVVGQRARDKGLDVLILCAESVPRRLIGDAMRLQQVLVNLVVNALKFTDQGQVVIEIDCSERSESMACLQVRVRDSGIGIPPEEIPRLFELFTQMDESSTRKHGGAGLGLAISRRLVQLMGGEIGADSVPGQGSTFWFSARLALDRQPAAHAATTGAAVPLGLRALVVDDNPAAREVFGNILRALKFEVELAADGEQALQRLLDEAAGCDLLLIDWQLPGLDGLQTVARLQQQARCPATVMVSAHADSALAEAAERAGIEVFLAKPISPSSLYDAALAALHRHAGALPPPTVTAVASAARFAAGQRVLVAEDNPINRVVAGEMLAALGLQAAFAESGREALRMLAEQRFDLVLMDIQMPELDGLDATRQLRQDRRHAGLPVIALTAHAMASDRDRCLAAGMNAVLTKPIEEAALVQVLARYLRAQDGNPSAAAAATAGDDVEPDEDRPGLQVERAVARLNGKRALYWRLFDDFRQRYQHSADSLAQALANGQAEEAARLAHAIKGAAASLGAVDLAAAAAAFEQAAGDQRQAQLPALAAALAALQSITVPTLASGRAAAADTGDATAALLQQLRSALQQQRLDAGRLFQRWHATMDPLHPSFTELEAIGLAIDRLDYPTALARLERLDV